MLGLVPSIPADPEFIDGGRYRLRRHADVVGTATRTATRRWYMRSVVTTA